MPSYLQHLVWATLAAGLVSAARTPLRVSDLTKKSSSTCTFTSAASASASKSSCSTIVLSNTEVPAGKTLNLTDLKDGTKVCQRGLPNVSLTSRRGKIFYGCK